MHDTDFAGLDMNRRIKIAAACRHRLSEYVGRQDDGEGGYFHLWNCSDCLSTVAGPAPARVCSTCKGAGGVEVIPPGKSAPWSAEVFDCGDCVAGFDPCESCGVAPATASGECPACALDAARAAA